MIGACVIKSGPPSAVETRQLYLHLPFPTVKREKKNMYHMTFDKPEVLHSLFATFHSQLICILGIRFLLASTLLGKK